jgi:hypothetical protein
MEDQKKWDEGFKAGIAEVLNALDDTATSSDLEGPTKDWVNEFKQKISNKYL